MCIQKAVVLGILSGGLVWLVSLLPFLNILELKTLDLRFTRREAPGGTACIVRIDEQTVTSWGQRSPIPRAQLADLIGVLSQAGARIIVLDVLLDQETSRDSDARLSRAIRECGKVILPFVIAEPKPVDKGVPRTPVLRPCKAFAEGALGTGFVNTIFDPDGAVRHMRLTMKGFSSLPLIAAQKFSKKKLVTRSELKRPLLINYHTPPGKAFSVLSAANVLRKEFEEQTVKNGIVVIGSYLSDASDRVVTLFSSPEKPTAGVEVLAYAITTLLGDRLWETVPFASSITLLFLGAVSAMLFSRQSTGWSIVSAIVATWILWTIADAAFQLWNGVVPLISPVVAVWMSLVTVHGAGGISELQERRRRTRSLESLFRRLISPQLAEEILYNPDQVGLGGMRRNVTVLFADLQGFTTRSERIPPEQVVEMLNEFLSRMVRVTLRQDGMVDKFIGDAIMVVFGAPIQRSDDTLRAVRCAVAMKREMEALQEHWKSAAKDPFGITIGINTGEVVAGHIGDPRWMEYTVIGDTVNVAARLQGMTKEFSEVILISESTYAEVRDHVVTRPLGEVTLRGRGTPVRVYALHGLRE